MDRLDLFANELNLLTDEDIKKFAVLLIENADPYFFEVAASSSGKYHPLFSLGDKGLVRHTKAVFYFAKAFAEASYTMGDIDERDIQFIMVCALAHDMKKQGDGEASGNTLMKEHPGLAAKFIERLYNEHKDEIPTITEADKDMMMGLATTHMGPWGLVKPSTTQQRLLFYADYAASRKELGLKIFGEDFKPVAARVIKENVYKDEPIMTFDGYIFNFGKHTGKKLDQVYAEAPDYLVWIANAQDFKHKEAQTLIIDYLMRKKRKLEEELKGVTTEK